MKRLVAIFAHPDDESLIAGSLSHYSDKGAHVTLICTTKGEAGEISNQALASTENLGTVREAELRCSCDVIGISELHLLGYCDSGMDGTPENDKTTAFIQADPDEIRFKLVKLLRRLKPNVVITFEPLGWYGHPDHIATGHYATEAYYLSGDPQIFPSAGPAWHPDRLFHAALIRSEFKPVVEYARSHGMDSSDFDLISWDEPDPLRDQVTHVFDATPYIDIKKKSMRCHKTQFGEDHLFYKLPPDISRKLNGQEFFIQVDPSAEPDLSPNGDLFAGIME
ncbi:MAG: PIG-L family deacetylase [Candidatus Promineifilaceae bacterium]